MTIHKVNNEITTLADWHKFAPPKQKDIHWADGRSAKEVARAWLEQAPEHMPAEVLAVLEEHPAFGPVVSWSAEPEAKLPFDSFAGETRNSDLAVQVTDKHGATCLRSRQRWTSLSETRLRKPGRMPRGGFRTIRNQTA